MNITANVCVPHCIINPTEYPNILISGCGSNPLKKPITIDYEGNLRICNHSPHIIGNIYNDSLKTLFSSDYVNKWKTEIPSLCSDCNKWTVCNGGCRAASEQMGLSLKNEDPIINLLNDNFNFKDSSLISS
jgi:radical SAM protein with 4Fe4S-binding SPASM domain